jgi:hypothetical protein
MISSNWERVTRNIDWPGRFKTGLTELVTNARTAWRKSEEAKTLNAQAPSQPATQKPPSYTKSVGLWAGTVAIFAFLIVRPADEQSLRIVIYYILLAGFVAFATLAARRNEFPVVQIIARLGGGALAGFFIVFLAPTILAFGTWLFAQPPLVHGINDVPLSWFVASMIFCGGLSAAGYFQKPPETSSYAEAIAFGAIGGSSLVAALIALTWKSALPTKVDIFNIVLLSVAVGGSVCAYGGVTTVANCRRELPVLRATIAPSPGWWSASLPDSLRLSFGSIITERPDCG